MTGVDFPSYASEAELLGIVRPTADFTRTVGERNTRIGGVLSSAYDLSSCGMAVQLHSTAQLLAGGALKDWQKSALETSGSNYIGMPYFLFSKLGHGTKDDIASKLGIIPNFYAPHTDHTSLLFKHVLVEYDRMDWQSFRMAMYGDVDLTDPHSGAPFTPGELEAFLVEGNNNGLVPNSGTLVIGDDNSLERLKNPIELIGYFMKRSMLRNPDSDFNVDFTYDFLKRVNDVHFSEKLLSQTRALAIKKLGLMLAITDQIAYDAYWSGNRIHADYRPADNDGRW